MSLCTDLHLDTNFACFFVKRSCNLNPIVSLITPSYLSNSLYKDLEASFLHLTSSLNKIKI